MAFLAAVLQEWRHVASISHWRRQRLRQRATDGFGHRFRHGLPLERRFNSAAQIVSHHCRSAFAALHICVVDSPPVDQPASRVQHKRLRRDRGAQSPSHGASLIANHGKIEMKLLRMRLDRGGRQVGIDAQPDEPKSRRRITRTQSNQLRQDSIGNRALRRIDDQRQNSLSRSDEFQSLAGCRPRRLQGNHRRRAG